VVIFSPITSNVYFVESYMFLEFQKYQAWTIFQQYMHLHMSAVHLCTLKYYVKIIYINILLNSATNLMLKQHRIEQFL